MSRIPRLLTVREATKKLHMSEGSVHLLIREGKIKAVKQGMVTRIQVGEILRWRGLLAMAMMRMTNQGKKPPKKMSVIAKHIEIWEDGKDILTGTGGNVQSGGII